MTYFHDGDAALNAEDTGVLECEQSRRWCVPPVLSTNVPV